MKNLNKKPSLKSDARVLMNLVFRPIKGKTHQDRLESFYSSQAENYDSFRARLLQGRQSLMTRMNLQEGEKWADLGCGTGANLDFVGEKIHQASAIHLVDLSSSLLEVARSRVDQIESENVYLHQEDVTELPFESASFDVVSFSYSLSMIPNWIKALEEAKRILKPGGRIAVVDFYVSKKQDEHLARHSWWTRNFWRVWFEFDNVFLGPETLHYLLTHFKEEMREEQRAKVPYLPLGRVPYFEFIGTR